jgi:hypothetical protein
MKIFGRVVREIGIIPRKWYRDAALQSPPLCLTQEIQIVKPERISCPLAKGKFK